MTMHSWVRLGSAVAHAKTQIDVEGEGRTCVKENMCVCVKWDANTDTQHTHNTRTCIAPPFRA